MILEVMVIGLERDRKKFFLREKSLDINAGNALGKKKGKVIFMNATILRPSSYLLLKMIVNT